MINKTSGLYLSAKKLVKKQKRIKNKTSSLFWTLDTIKDPKYIDQRDEKFTTLNFIVVPLKGN